MAGEPGTSGSRPVSASIVRHTLVVPGFEGQYSAWRAELTVALGKHPGFRNLEVYPPDEAQPEWVSIEHFDSLEAAQSWLQSPIRVELAHQVAECVAGPDSLAVVTEGAPDRPSEVTAVITNRVRPGRELEFRRWQERIQTAQSQFPGYRGITVQAPIEGVNPAWVTLLRFDNADNLRDWLNSPECTALAEESDSFLDEGVVRITRTSFNNWLPAEERAQEPSLWRVNAIVLLVLYPVVMSEIIFLYPRLPLPLGPQTFVGNAISVGLTGFLLVPWAAGLLKWWLAPTPAGGRGTTVLGWAGVIAMYLALIAAMSWLASAFL